MREKQSFCERIRGNAEWEMVKFIGGSGMLTSVWQAVRSAIQHDRPEWILWGWVFAAGLALAILGYWHRPLPVETIENQLLTAPEVPIVQPELEVFVPLQIEVFRLAKDIGGFLDRVGTEPQADPLLMNHLQSGGAARCLADMYKRVDSWRLRCKSEFDSDFRERIKTTLLRFGMEGLLDERLNELLLADLNAGRAREIQARLVALAHRLNGVMLSAQGAARSAADIFLWRTVDHMGQQEYKDGLDNVPGFREAVDNTPQVHG